jgi:hypothetical protein
LKGGDSLSSKGVFRRRGRKGQSLVELALTLPLLVLIMFGVLDMGRAFFALITIHNAAREGARYATLNRSHLYNIESIARDEARNSGISPVNPDHLNVSYVCEDNCMNEAITVTVTYTFELAMGLLPEIFPNREILMSRSVSMLLP